MVIIFYKVQVKLKSVTAAVEIYMRILKNKLIQKHSRDKPVGKRRVTYPLTHSFTFMEHSFEAHAKETGI